MFIISILIFVLMIVGMFLILNLSPATLSEDIDKVVNPNETIKKRALKVQKNKKDNFFRRFLKETQDIMRYLNQSSKFVIVCILSVALSVIGIVVSLSVNNIFIMPALVVGFFSMPFIFVRLYSYTFTRHLKDEMEIALSQITASYMRTNDIINAVEENINNMTNPIRKAFEDFVYQVKFVNPNVRQAVDDLSKKIDDDIFKEWCSSLKKCLNNHMLKHLLEPAIEKYSTLRSIENKISLQLTSIKTSFILIVLLVYSNIPLLYFLNKEWFGVLINTVQGQAAIGVSALITVIETIMLVYIIKPLSYKI